MLNGQKLELTPPPPSKVGRLNSFRAIRVELTRVYRDMRSGKIPSCEGTRLAFVLTAIARVLEQGDLEQRIERLEGATAAAAHKEREHAN
jgi:hypothetical protein